MAILNDDDFFAAPPAAVPDDLVQAVIGQESGGKGGLRSPAGALGLMQVMPDTGRTVAGQLGLDYDEGRLQHDDDYNRQLGTAYLGQMLERYGGDRQLALAAYNAGPGAVDRWLAQGAPKGGLPKETLAYVPSVLKRLGNGQVSRETLSDEEFFGGGQQDEGPPGLDPNAPDDADFLGEGEGQQAGAGQAAWLGFRRGLATDIAGRVQQVGTAGQEEPQLQGEEGRLAQPLDFATMPWNADWSKVAYQAARGFTATAPHMAAAMAGAAAAQTAFPVAPGIAAGVGAAIGAGGVEAVLGFAPIYGEELRRTPQDRDGAWERAVTRAATSAGITGASFGLFELKPFFGPIRGLLDAAMEPGADAAAKAAAAAARSRIPGAVAKDLAVQAGIVQPGVAAAGRAIENVQTDRPAGEGVGTAAIEGALYTAVPALAHAGASRIARAVRGRGAGPSAVGGEKGGAPEAASAPPGGADGMAPEGDFVGGTTVGTYDHQTGAIRVKQVEPIDVPAQEEKLPHASVGNESATQSPPPPTVPPPPAPLIDPLEATRAAATGDGAAPLVGPLGEALGKIDAQRGTVDVDLDMPAKVMAAAEQAPPQAAPPIPPTPPAEQRQAAIAAATPPQAEILPPEMGAGRPVAEPPRGVSAPEGASQRAEEGAVTSEPPGLGGAEIIQSPAEPAVSPQRAEPTAEPAAPQPRVDRSQPTAADVAAAAAEAHPSPTEGQKKAGNYRKGPLRLHGLDISIESAKGSTRSGRDINGKEWKAKLPAAYGYIKRTRGGDGDHVDVFVGPHPQSTYVAVVDQFEPKTKGFDEHKVILGTRNAKEAKALYDRAFSDGSGPRRRKAVTDMTVDGLKAWLESGDTTRPHAEIAPRRPRRAPPQTLAEFIATRGGMTDPGGELAAMGADAWHRRRPGRRKLVAPAFQQGADMLGARGDKHRLDPDYVLEAAKEAGYLPEDATQRELYEALDEEMRGRPRYVPGEEPAAEERSHWKRTQHDAESVGGGDPAEASPREIGNYLDRHADSDADLDFAQQALEAHIDGEIAGEVAAIDDPQERHRAALDHDIPFDVLDRVHAPADLAGGEAAARPAEPGRPGAAGPGEEAAAGEARVAPPGGREAPPLDDDIPFAVRRRTEAAAPDDNARLVLADLGQQLRDAGLHNAAVFLVDRIDAGGGRVANARVLGRVVEMARDTVEKRRTLDHEIVHLVYPSLTAGERGALRRAAGLWRRRYKIDDRYGHLDLSPERLDEEAIADAYSDQKAGRLHPQGMVRQALGRIGRFVEALANWSNGHGWRTAADVFRAIASGEAGRRGANQEQTRAAASVRDPKFEELQARHRARQEEAKRLAAENEAVHFGPDRWGMTSIASADTVRPGGFRLTSFDNRGEATGHIEFGTLAEAIMEGGKHGAPVAEVVPRAKGQQRPTVDKIDAGEQTVLPGAERLTDREFAELKMGQRAPTRAPKAGQASVGDLPLFDTGARAQQDLFAAPAPREAARPAGSDLFAAKVEKDGPVDRLRQDLRDRLGLSDLQMFATPAGDLRLDRIVVPKDRQRQGIGTKAMREITAFADREGMRITLTPDAGFGATSRDRLAAFYKRFGFVENKGRGRDLSISEDMYREPAKQGSLFSIRDAAQAAGEEESAFRRWFGRSRIVGARGEPLVMYRGSWEDGPGSFRKGPAGAIFFSPDRAYAGSYGDNLSAAYLKVEKPLDLRDIGEGAPQEMLQRMAERGLDISRVRLPSDMTAPEARNTVYGYVDDRGKHVLGLYEMIGDNWRDDGNLAAEIRRQGFDGILFPPEGGRDTAAPVVAVWDPAQVKPLRPGQFSIRDPLSDRLVRGVDRLAEDAQRMSSWRDWYDRHQAVIARIFGGDADLFRRVLSATSQANTVKGNVSLAIKAYEQMKAGKPFAGYLPAVAKNLERIRATEALRGPKIAAYGQANEGKAAAAPVDRHIAMLMFNVTGPTGRQIAKARATIDTIAKRLGWKPRQVQAALWAANQVRRGMRPEEVQSYDRILEARADEIAALRSRFAEPEGARAGAPGRRDAAARDQEAAGAKAGVGPSAFSIRYDGFDDRGNEYNAWRQGRPGPVYDHARDWTLEQQGRDGYEHLVVVEPDGTPIEVGTSGLKDTIRFAPSLVARLASRVEAVGHHNHPSGRSLSTQDISAMGLPGLRAVWAHGKQAGSFGAALRDGIADWMMRRLGDPHSTQIKLGTLVADIHRAVVETLRPHVRSGAVPTDHANTWVGHATQLVLDAAGITHYQHDVEPSVISHPGYQEALAAGFKQAQIAKQRFEHDIGTRWPKDFGRSAGALLIGRDASGARRGSGAAGQAGSGAAGVAGPGAGVSGGAGEGGAGGPPGLTLTPPPAPQTRRQEALPVGTEAQRAPRPPQQPIGEQPTVEPGGQGRLFQPDGRFSIRDRGPRDNGGPPIEDERIAPVFFSALTRAGEAIPQAKGSPEQMLAMLRKQPGVKREELAWSGVEDWLKQQKGPVTREQVADYLRANEVKVEETVNGGEVGPEPAPPAEYVSVSRQLTALESKLLHTPPGPAREAAQAEAARLRNRAEQLRGEWMKAVHAWERTKPPRPAFADYQIPGGLQGSYRELLLRVPSIEKPDTPEVQALLAERGQIAARRHLLQAQMDAAPTEEWRRLRDERDKLERRENEINDQIERLGGRQDSIDWTQGHWAEPNVIAHVRFDEARERGGKLVLRVQEFQSDLHQAGRDEGYLGTPKERADAGIEFRALDDRARALRKELADEIRAKAGPGAFVDARDIEQHPRWPEAKRLTEEAHRAYDRWDKLGEGVPNLPFKSTEAWTSLAVRRIIRWAAEKGYDRVVWMPGRFIRDAVGGESEGQTGYYDEMLPKIVGRVLKPWGGKVVQTELRSGAEDYRPYEVSPGRWRIGTAEDAAKYGNRSDIDWLQTFASEREASDYLDEGADPAYAFDITPAMRDSVMREGQPLFQIRERDDLDELLRRDAEPAGAPPPSPAAKATAGGGGRGPIGYFKWLAGQDALPHHADLGMLGRVLATPEWIAAHHPGFGHVWTTAKERLAWREATISRLLRTARPYFTASPADRARANAFLEIADSQGVDPRTGNQWTLTNYKGGPDDPFGLQLSKRGEVITLTPKQREVVLSIRKALDDALGLIRRSIYRQFDMDPDIAGTPKDADEALQMAAKAVNPQRKDMWERLAYQLDKVDRMKATGYIPHARFGSHAIAVKDESGRNAALHTYETRSIFGDRVGRIWKASEIARERERLRRIYEPLGLRVTQPFELFKNPDELRAIGVSIGALDNLASFVGADGQTYNPFRDAVVKAYQTAGFGSHFLHRVNMPGYSGDLERALGAYINGVAGFAAKREFGNRMEAARTQLDTRREPNVAEYATRYLDYLDSGKAEAEKLRAATYLFTVGGNISSAVRDLFQLPLITAPYLHMFASHPKVAAAMARATKDVIASLRPGRFDIDSLPADVRAAVKRADDEGILARKNTPEETALAMGDRAMWLRDLARPVRRTLEAVTSLYTAAQRVNRLVSFIATHRLAQDPAFLRKMRSVLVRDGAFMAAHPLETTPYQAAAWATDATHFDITKVNRPAIQRGRLGALLTQFKGYHLNQMALLERQARLYGPEGRKALLYTLAGYATLSGLMGLPFAQNIVDAVEAGSKLVFGRTINLLTEWYRMLDEIGVPKALQEAAWTGPSRLLGIDMGRRMGIGEPLPTDPQTLVDYRSVFGPALGVFAIGGVAALDQLRQGRPLGAASLLLPPPARGLAQAAKLADEGYRSQARGTPLVPKAQITGAELAQQAMGFRPARFARIQEMMRAQMDQLASNRERGDEFRRQLQGMLVDRAAAQDPGQRTEVDSQIRDLFKAAVAYNRGAALEDRIPLPKAGEYRQLYRKALQGVGGPSKNIPRSQRRAVAALQGSYPQ